MDRFNSNKFKGDEEVFELYYYKTSAKTGKNVESSALCLADVIV